MTKTGVGYLSALRRLCVGQLVGALGVVLLAASGAQAGAWEEFETRCLVPMENAETPKIDDLTSYEIQLLEGEEGYPASNDLVIYVSNDPTKAAQCRPFVSDDKMAHEFTSAARAHFQSQIATGRYTIFEEFSAGWTLHSNEWREPVLAIEIGWFRPEFTSLVIKETDLES